MNRFEKERPRSESIQLHINRKVWAAMEARGQDRLFPPFMVWQRFEELALARHYGYRQRAFRNSPKTARDIEERRLARDCIARARRCEKPMLP